MKLILIGGGTLAGWALLRHTHGPVARLTAWMPPPHDMLRGAAVAAAVWLGWHAVRRFDRRHHNHHLLHFAEAAAAAFAALAVCAWFLHQAVPALPVAAAAVVCATAAAGVLWLAACIRPGKHQTLEEGDH